MRGVAEKALESPEARILSIVSDWVKDLPEKHQRSLGARLMTELMPSKVEDITTTNAERERDAKALQFIMEFMARG